MGSTIVIVDDLDRLDNKEVFSVFQVIRNSADFANTMFIIPFDKEYVIKSLTENKIPKPDEYIKKMFDVELSLPPISITYLETIFVTLANNSIEKYTQLSSERLFDHFKKQIETIILSGDTIENESPKYSRIRFEIFNNLKNKRDLIRFTNSFSFSFKANNTNIYLPDLLILELIKYFNIVKYREIFETLNYTVKVAEGNRDKHILYTREIDNIFHKNHSFLKKKIGQFDICSTNNDSRINVSAIIKELFREPDKRDFHAKFAFCYPENFASYLEYRENNLINTLTQEY